MWKPLQKSPAFFVKYAQEKDSLLIDITDYQKCWNCDFDRKTLLNILKESNDGLEFDDDNELMDRGLDMLNNPESLKKVTILPQSTGSLNLVITKQYEITLKLELSLIESSSEHFFQVIVQPLLKTVCDLRSSENELRAALLKKDREIEEYKIEGRAPRRLITTIYDDVAHMSKHTAFEECFGAKNLDISELLKSSFVAKPVTKPQPNNVPANPTSTDNKPESSTKVEKCSQETVIKENPLSTLINETVSSESVKPSDVKIPKVETLPSPRKRQRNRLNL